MRLRLASAYAREYLEIPVTFAYEQIVDSVQLSYVWCVCDPVSNNRSVEEFLAKIYCHSPPSTYSENELAWDQRVDIPGWLTTMHIGDVTPPELRDIISTALQLLHEASTTINVRLCALLASLDVNLQGWFLTEQDAVRNPVGASSIVLLQTIADYIFLEVHLES